MRHLTLFSLLLLSLVACTEQAPPPTATLAPPALVPTASPVLPTLLPTRTVLLPALAAVEENAPPPSPTAAPATVRPLPTPTAPAPASPTAPAPTATFLPPTPLPAGDALDRNEIGIQVHLHRQDVRQLIAHLERLGAGWVKVQVKWAVFEPEPDRYGEEWLTELDEFVARAEAAGFKIMLSVAKAPEWSRPVAEMDGPPADYGHFADFLTFLAGRYRGQIAAYELWNEPNLQVEWYGYPLNAADFVRLVGVGAAAVRETDPAALLIGGAPAVTGINDGVLAIDDRVYFRQMLEAGVADVVDVLGVHPYGWANPPDATVTQPDPAASSHNNHPSFFFRDTLLDYRALLEAYGLDRPLWVTEFGWGSYDQMGAPPPADVPYMADVDEQQQARYTVRAFELAQEWEWVGPMMLWNLNMAPELGTDSSFAGYSLLRPDGSPRPVYQALAAAPKR